MVQNRINEEDRRGTYQEFDNHGDVWMVRERKKK